jgi:hypothetical protein
MIKRLNRGYSSGSPDGSNSGTDFMPEQAAVDRRYEKGSVKKGFHCPGHTRKVNWRAEQKAICLFNFLNPFIYRIVFDGTGFVLIFYTAMTSNTSLDLFFTDQDHFSFNTGFSNSVKTVFMEQAVFPFFLALPLNPTTFKFGLHLF